jgi:hypothetical protein
MLGELGYTLDFKLTPEETLKLRYFVECHYGMRLALTESKYVPIESYHKLKDIDHVKLWPKNHRVLPWYFIPEIRSMPFMKNLKERFGEFEIADADNFGRSEFCWRLVRPNEPTDVGPMHADSWFWDVRQDYMPEGYHRVRVWIALWCEPGLNGLLVVPGSQKESYPYGGHGTGKPIPKFDPESLNPILLKTDPGQAVVFHDNLLHGGALNRGTRPRVSMEFTMLVKDDDGQATEG